MTNAELIRLNDDVLKPVVALVTGNGKEMKIVDVDENFSLSIVRFRFDRTDVNQFFGRRRLVFGRLRREKGKKRLDMFYGGEFGFDYAC